VVKNKLSISVQMQEKSEGVPVYIHESVSFPAAIDNVVDDEPVPFAEYLADLAQAIGVPKPFRLPTILGKWMFAPSRRF
jgi:hypothetical protein